jgi:hypothetical protein
MTLPAGTDDHRIKGAHSSELRFPRFITVRRFAHRPRENAVFSDDHEEREVNRIHAFAENAALAAALSFCFQESHRILEMIAPDVPA